MESLTVVDYRGGRSAYSCGYCGDVCGKLSHGMSTYSMTSLDYQSLIDRGWRRSGKYCYKPVMHQTCCPQYTIRCRVLECSPTKSQKKVLKRVGQFLTSEDYFEVEKWKSKYAMQQPQQSGHAVGRDDGIEDGIAKQTPVKDGGLAGDIGNFGHSRDLEDTKQAAEKSAVKGKKISPGAGPDPYKPLCKKAKLARLEKKALKQGTSGTGDASTTFKNVRQTTKSLQQSLPHLSDDARFRKKLEVKTVRAKVGNNDFEATRKESHAVYQKYQQVIHGDALLECGEKQWIRFLVNSSLIHDSSGPGPGYGNYHQQYLLDGRIIAVGVVDILPNCLSSVYFYYDPDYGFMSLGIYSALSEIAYTQQLHLQSNSMCYYYMGFYIHDCQKMKYKASYLPSDLLCPETYQWVPISLCKPALDKKKYLRLNILNGGAPEAQDCLRGHDFNLDELHVVYGQALMKYNVYKNLYYSASCIEEENATEDEKRSALRQKRRALAEEKLLQEYVSLVGTECARRMCISL